MSTSGGAGTPVPAGFVNVGAVGTGSNSLAAATIAAIAAKTNYLTSIVLTSDGATAPTAVIVTVSGLLVPFTFVYDVMGVDAQSSPVQLNFNPPLMASGPNQNISVSVPALGAGNANVRVVALGIQG